MKIGLIADVQYCDCDNKWNFEKTKERFYRNSLNHLDNSLNYFKENDCKKILQLGDLVDGNCKKYNNRDDAITQLKKRFHSKDFETFHVTGNHELYNFTRSDLLNSFMGDSKNTYQNNNTDLNYYKVNITSKLSLIVLDTYEISVLNKRDSSLINDMDHANAEKILRENNKNESWTNPIGAKKRKYVSFNGGIGETQLKWLEEQLEECTISGAIVILAGHIPLISEDRNPLCLLWNDQEVLDIISRYPCVKAYICGHAHTPSLIVVTDQFIHLLMPGIIEALPNERPFGILEIFHDKLILSDMPGYWPSLEFKFNETK